MVVVMVLTVEGALLTVVVAAELQIFDKAVQP
jgi:hypothetical protein